MGEKVTFNSITRRITIDEAPDVNGEIFIDVKSDLYSDGKEDWVANEALRRVEFPLSTVGGNPLPGSKELGATFFIAPDWKIQPYEASHKLTINGNFYAEDGSDPFLDTVGTYTVRIVQQVSSLVDSTVQQLEEIEYASFEGGVTVDVTSSHTGTDYPVGTRQSPVNNFTDALAIAADRGFLRLYIDGDATINSSEDYSNFEIIGQSPNKSTLTINASADTTGCEFKNATITGTLDGENFISDCVVVDLTYVNGSVLNCGLIGDIELDGNLDAVINDCYTIDQDDPPVVDMGGSGQSLSMSNYSGLLSLKNLNDPSQEVGVGLDAGMIVIEDTITAGTIILSGIGGVTDNSTGAAMVDVSTLISNQSITNNVWGADPADFIDGANMGGALLRSLMLSQENYYLDNPTYTTYNGLKLLTSARIRLYSDPASVGTASDVIATYAVTSVWSADELQSYKVVKQ